MSLKSIGFDADDTLWHNETLFRLTEERFCELLAGHAEPGVLAARLLETEKRNLRLYGYGVKGFVLSMIETALDLTEGRVPTAVIAEIVAAGREMIAHPVELLPGVRETVERLAEARPLVLITKGDLFHQEQKVARSGLGELFAAVEIVSEKDAATYARVFARWGGPDTAMMVGNSLKSDVLPALEAGAWGVHVPRHTTWALEHADAPEGAERFVALERIDALPDLVAAIAA